MQVTPLGVVPRGGELCMALVLIALALALTSYRLSALLLIASRPRIVERAKGRSK
ncbi:MAG: hypothetical protein HXX20_24520 [Chloroflexi bacterium]|nr:hypothetical protein [Chloroflexota bacterium]